MMYIENAIRHSPPVVDEVDMVENRKQPGRRTFLGVGLRLTGMLALAACGRPVESQRSADDSGSFPDLRARQGGTTREFRRIVEPGEIEVAPGVVYRTWLYNGRFPGEEIRVREGERLLVTVENRLPEATTIHWHGVPVPNAMDGVPDLPRPPIAPGKMFAYDFTAGPAGTYFYHSHVGLQVDRGLIGPLVVEEITPHVQWDREYTVVLDDFLPGAPQMSSRGGGMGMGRGMMGMMGSDTPPYAGMLMNGLLPDAAPTFEVGRGDRLRLRLINGSGGTTFRIALAGHRLTVSHADGRPVEPVSVDSLDIGAGERYDVIIDANNAGAWALLAVPHEVRVEPARAIVRYREAAATSVPKGQVPEGLSGGRILSSGDLVARELGTGLAKADRTFDLTLSGGMMSREWTINGQAYPDAEPLEVHQGERVRVRMTNHSMMIHPMHLHGHFFQTGRALKDTVLVSPHMGRAEFTFVANNPGDWFFHCHNLYHMESGMARIVRYLS
jgi:FtsP/CotA-like multicopper oxidase with cupredoxin domain